MCFGEVLTAMVTPFHEDGSVNYEKAQELAMHLLNNGSDGLVISGTTGESPTLTYDETETLFREVKDAVGNKGTIIGGAGSNSTNEIIKHIKIYNKIGLDGYLSVVPYYNKPTQTGLFKHFEAINAAVECPIMLYNIPGRTGINLDVDTTAKLAELKNIKALKESTGSVDDLSQLKLKLPEDFSIYSGDDFMTLTAVALGATGVVSVASHFMGKEIKEMIQSVKNNNMDRARELHLRLYPLFKGVFVTASPIPTKTGLNLLGYEVGGFRPPMCDATPEQTEFMKNLLKQYELLS